jgi:peptidoglycan/LPS O-acetylase OafA/YrhL
MSGANPRAAVANAARAMIVFGSNSNLPLGHSKLSRNFRRDGGYVTVRRVSVSATRNSRIDLLRGASIFAVLLLHFSLTYRLTDSPLSLVLPEKWIRAVVVNGNYGVTLFFVISGFLITSNNLARYGRLSDTRLGQFYAWRFSRIVPPLILALIVIVTLGAMKVPSFADSGGHQLPDAVLCALAIGSVITFWHNVLMQHVGYFNYCLNIYWSLSVEEVFYLAFPVACVLLKRNGRIAGLCGIFIIAGPIYRSIHRDDELYFMYGYLACFDAIAFGCLTALISQKLVLGESAGRLIRFAAGTGLAVVYLAGIDGHEVFGFTLMALCTAVLLLGAFGAPQKKSGRLPTRIVCWFGRHSYELYLFHIIVLAAMRDIVPKDALPYLLKLPFLALFVLLSAAAAGAVSRFYAEPLNRRLRLLSSLPYAEVKP